MRTFILALLLIGAAAVPALAADEAVSVGRVFVIEPGKGYLIAQFPDGPRFIYINRADSFRYKEGDEIRLDSKGRILS